MFLNKKTGWWIMSQKSIIGMMTLMCRKITELEDNLN
jgi:hypothetical protein